MDNGFSLADIKAVTDNEHDGWGGGSWWILLLFIIMMGGGNGFGWGNRGVENAIASQADVQRGFNQQTTTSKLDELAYGMANSGYENLRLNYQSQLSSVGAFNALGSQIDNCCCSTKMEIANNRYDAERNASAIQAAVHAEGEATRALIQENKIEALQNKIQALELQSAMCGVVRYPTGTTYSAGAWPFGGSSCSPCYGGTTF